ncbi:hypothetical protein BC826DRAFT_974697 [Russula brevipes]|nr:hypothetical protein BC826DRAFT_974697 [Russula brevipes]
MAGLLEGAETADCCVRHSLGVHMVEEVYSRPPQPYIQVAFERGTDGTAGAVYDHREQRHSVVTGRQSTGRAEATQDLRKRSDGARQKPERHLSVYCHAAPFSRQSTIGLPDARYNALVLQLVKGNMNPYKKPIRIVFQDRLTSAPTVLERHLASRTFLVTEHITLPGITLAAELQHAFTTIVDATLRAKLPNVFRHFETIPEAEKKPKKEEADDDDDDKQYEEAPKEKNPLDLVPKSTLNLEDWKRAYSDEDTRGADGSLEWLYRMLLTLVWISKYNEELTQTFMSSNPIGGFFNRLEASRKYWFGSVGVLGTTYNSIIRGALIPRG